jgi:hypothetical protein
MLNALAKEPIVNCPRFDLSPQEATKIATFLGYGNPGAPVWFIGFEEGLGKMSDDEAVRNLKARGNFSSVMDLREAHLQLLENGKHIDIAIDPPSTQVWRFMAKIMLARDGRKDWHTSRAAKEYVKKMLGRSGGDTFLTELSPIPKGKNSDTRWMAEFEQCDANLGREIESRREQLRKLLKERASNPPLVICYGESKRTDFEELLQIKWRPIFFGVHSAIDSKHLLLPFFGQGHMNDCVIARLCDLGLLQQQ